MENCHWVAPLIQTNQSFGADGLQPPRPTNSPSKSDCAARADLLRLKDAPI